MDDFISREDTIEKMEEVDWYHQNKNGEMVHGANPSEHQAWYKAEDVYKVLEDMPSAQPERIQNNAVHLCDSCQYTYVTCPSHGNDAVFGDGKGNDNICACNKYRPISAQPEREKGYMKIKVISAVDGEDLFCENCDAYCLSPSYNFCPKCGVEFIGVRGEQDE